MYFLSPNVEWVAMPYSSHILVWSLADGHFMGSVPSSGGYFPGTGVTFSSDGSLLTVIEKDGMVAIWKLK